jgi:hypothetical protein
MKRILQSTLRRRMAALSMLGIAAIATSACVTSPSPLSEGIGFREARHAEIAAMRDYRTCRDHALDIDQEARIKGEPAKYLASARMIETCESGLGPDTAEIAREERMRAYALTVQNYFKGGDVKKARENLEKFETAYAGDDLFYADGSSFTETMQVLLGMSGRSAIGRHSEANVNRQLKMELRRVSYWQHH